MPAALTSGDFSRATHLSVKTLRHHHRVGLLAPADVDADPGYRSPTPAAHGIST
jgi:DNA-binding transcriptional MerR regulator